MAQLQTITGSFAPQLPQELLMQIFLQLSISDIKICRCVCRSWAWSASILLSDLTFLNFKASLKDTISEEFLSPLSIATFKCLKLRKVSIAFSSDAIAAKWLWGPIVASSKSLTLEKCSITERDFVRFLTHYLGIDFTGHLRGNSSILEEKKSASTLRSLSLIDCRDLFMSGGLLDKPDDLKIAHIVLSNVTCLDISQNSYLTDQLFQRLVQCMPKLEALIMNETNIQHHPGIYKKFYPDHVIEGIENNPENEKKDSRVFNSPSILTFGCLLQYLKTKGSNITKLGLQGTNLPDSMIHEISEIPELALKCLDISRNPGIKQESMKIFTERNSCHLEKLNISYCRRITMDYNPNLLGIFENLANLTKLVIHGISCNKGFDECLLLLKHLEYLDLADCDIPARHLADGIVKPLEETCFTLNMSFSDIKPTTVKSDLENKLRNMNGHSLMKEAGKNCCASKLQVLIFSKYLRAPEQIVRILRWTPNLIRLNFNGCTLSQTAMAQLFQTLCLSALNELDLNKCEETGNLDSKAQLLEPKELKMPEQITYRVIKERLNGSVTGGNVNLRSKYGNIGDLKSLTVLRISENLVTDSTVIDAFHFYDLRIIDVSGCENITSEGFIALARQNTHIEHLTAKLCIGLDDLGVIAIACCLKRLVHLDMESCFNVTSTALTLTSGCDALVGLLSSSTWYTNTKGLSGCKLLRFLNISKCPQISPIAAEALSDILGPSLRIKMNDQTNVRNLDYLESFH